MNLFDPDERYGSVDPTWSREELLTKDGVFKLTHVCNILKLNQPALRKFLNDQAREGQDTYALYGLKKEQGGWFVRMRVFREILEKIEQRVGRQKKRTQFKKVPKNIGYEKFFKLEGIYKLADVMEPNFLPYSYDQITALIRRGFDPDDDQALPRELCGCWLDKERSRFWLCDFLPFLAFVVSVWRGVSLEEARILVHKERGSEPKS